MGPRAQRSRLSYYLARKYPDAISSAQRFLSIHPGNKEAPYASYLVAMSYYNQIEDVTRDQRITQQASDSFGELIRRYPDSRYAADARLKIDLINDHLAGKEMEIGRYYERAGNWLARNRFPTVVEKCRPPATRRGAPPSGRMLFSLGIRRSEEVGRGARPNFIRQQMVSAQLRAIQRQARKAEPARRRAAAQRL